MSTPIDTTPGGSITTSTNDPTNDSAVGPQEKNPPDESVRPFTTIRWILVCVGLYHGALLYGLDTTIAADVQGPIVESLGEIEKLAWVGIGFPMGSVAMSLLICNFYDLFEIKHIIIISFILFEAGSALCGAAPTMNVLIVGRVMAGIGGAGIYLGILNYFANFTRVKERAMYNAIIGIVWGVGCILGPVVGGSFADSKASWRWAFYINLPLAAVCSPIYIWLLPRFNAQPRVSRLEKLVKIDWAGALLNALTVCIFMIALNFSGSAWTWGDPGSVAIWVIFGISLIAFALQSTFSIFTLPGRRLFPVQFLRSRTLVLLYFTTAAAGTCLTITIYYIPLLFQFTRGDSAIQAAARLLPFIGLNILFNIFSGAILPSIGGYMLLYLLSSAFMATGGILMLLSGINTKTSMIYGSEAIMAVGSGLAQQAGYSIAAAKVQPFEVPSVIGYINTAQLGGTAIALSISGAIFQNVGFSSLKSVLAEYNFTNNEIRSALAGTQSAILAQSSDIVRELAIESIADTIAKIFVMIAAAGGLMFISALFLQPEKLHLAGATGVLK